LTTHGSSELAHALLFFGLGSERLQLLDEVGDDNVAGAAAVGVREELFDSAGVNAGDGAGNEGVHEGTGVDQAFVGVVQLGEHGLEGRSVGDEDLPSCSSALTKLLFRDVLRMLPLLGSTPCLGLLCLGADGW